jgi:sensor histidine kinase YesM
MKEWTRKRKADVCMGILLQIYFFFPWIRIDGGYHTIHVYLIEIFRKESCIKAYNYIFLSGHPILWKYSGFAAVTFTMIIAFMIVMQMIELWQLYRHMKGIKTFDIHRYVWVLAIVLFFLYLDASYIYLDDSALFKLRIYMYMVIFIGIIGIWMFLDIEAAAWDTETAKHKTELKERDEQLLQVKVKALEEKYQEMLKSRKVVHDMKNHLLALKKYDQERDWEGLHQYLNELSDDMLDDSYQIWTGNHMLDMILNQKEKDAQRQKTDMQIDTEVFSTLPFTDREIISLFGNLLDNALEACEQIKGKERWIRIKIKKKNQLIYIEIANAIAKKPDQNGSGFISTKKENGLHGYGMRNIRDIVEKYEGIFQYEIRDESLMVIISVYA